MVGRAEGAGRAGTRPLLGPARLLPRCAGHAPVVQATPPLRRPRPPATPLPSLPFSLLLPLPLSLPLPSCIRQAFRRHPWWALPSQPFHRQSWWALPSHPFPPLRDVLQPNRGAIRSPCPGTAVAERSGCDGHAGGTRCSPAPGGAGVTAGAGDGHTTSPPHIPWRWGWSPGALAGAGDGHSTNPPHIPWRWGWSPGAISPMAVHSQCGVPRHTGAQVGGSCGAPWPLRCSCPLPGPVLPSPGLLRQGWERL